MVWETIKEIAVVVGVPVARSLMGWAEASFKDGKVDTIEWKRLGETVFRVGGLGLFAYLGINAIPGVDINIMLPAAGAAVVDYAIHLFKKLKK